MSVLLGPDTFDGASDSYCVSYEVLEPTDTNQLCEKGTLESGSLSPEPPDSEGAAGDGVVLDKEIVDSEAEVMIVESDTVAPGSDCIILKLGDKGTGNSKALCLSGKMLEMLDGNFTFIEHSKEGGNDIYTPIKIYNGSIVYVLTNTLLQAMGDPQPTQDAEAKRERSKGFPCSYTNCVKSYASLHHLKVHMMAHTGVRPFKCTDVQCQKAFSTSFALKTHVRTHNGERPYICRHRGCLKSFKTSGDLHKHIRVHTGERPFVCPVPKCGRSFTTCNICKVHVRTHTGERPYKCTHPGCTKTFASVTNQRNHLRIHSGEKPYVCTVPECGRKFTEYSSLYKHNQIHRLRHACPSCGKGYRTIHTLAMHVNTSHKDLINAPNGPKIHEVFLVNESADADDDEDGLCTVEDILRVINS